MRDNAPSTIVDDKLMSPHNYARHGLLPSPKEDKFQLSMTINKATLLSRACNAFDNDVVPIAENICDYPFKKNFHQKIWNSKTWAVVNTTASTAVQESLCSNQTNGPKCRVIDIALYSKGKVGRISVEGSNRNPNICDILTEFYFSAQNNKQIGELLFTSQSTMEYMTIGEGCGSMTMPMSDGRLSIFASGMAEFLLQRIQASFIHNGMMLIGTLDEHGLGVNWFSQEVKPITSIYCTNNSLWEVRIHNDVHDKIKNEILKCPGVETGGILLGRISELRHTFNVIDIILSPTDSCKSINKFLLGMQGVDKS